MTQWMTWPMGTLPVSGTLGGRERVRWHTGAASIREINPAAGNVIGYVLTANTTFLIRPQPNGLACAVTLILLQDGTGSRTVTWPSNVDWGTAAAPTLTTTANKADVVTLLTTTGNQWAAFLSGKGFSAF